MTKEEYNRKMHELREQRDFHNREYRRLMEEMDRLETDEKPFADVLGKFILIDNRSDGGYKEYFHVHFYEKRPRGVTLYGKGFSIGSKRNYVHISETLTIYWTEADKIKIIDSDEFYESFDELLSEIKFSLVQYDKYTKMDDLFGLKKKLISGEIKPVWDEEIK